MKIDYYLKKRKGFALIIAVGVLSVLTLVTIAFTVMSRLEEQTATNFKYSVNAKCLAEAGINKAIAGLKSKARSDFTWSVDNTGTGETDWYNGYTDATILIVKGKYTAKIKD